MRVTESTGPMRGHDLGSTGSAALVQNPAPARVNASDTGELRFRQAMQHIDTTDYGLEGTTSSIDARGTSRVSGRTNTGFVSNTTTGMRTSRHVSKTGRRGPSHAARKEQIYKLATQVYPNDGRAYNNLATLAYAKGNYDVARDYIQQAQRVAPALAEAKANLGMLALANGDIATAEQYIASATDANGLNEVLGNLNLAKGNFAQAEQDFADVYSNSAALAQILNKNYASADITLRYVKNPDATTEYLKAILYARMGNTADAAEALRNAVARDASYADYAAKDIELAKIQK